jgi:hypothetical protein
MKKNKTTSPVFPSQYVTDAEKNSLEFGKLIGQVIKSEWFDKLGDTCAYFSRLSKMRDNYIYAVGRQPVSKFKKILSYNGDLSYININWEILPVIPKFIDIIVNGIVNKEYKAKSKAIDALSQKRRTMKQHQIEKQMAAKQTLELIQEKTGVNPFTMDKDTLPTDDEHLRIFLDMEMKPTIEIAIESLVNCVNEIDNNYNDTIRVELAKDQVIQGVSFGKTRFSEYDGIIQERLDPESTVHSYTDDPYFRDCFYWGNVKVIHKSELLKYNPRLTELEIDKIAEEGSSWVQSFQFRNYYDFDEKECVAILDYAYKTISKKKWKKKKTKQGGHKVIEKEDDFNPSIEMQQEYDFSVIERDAEVWYEGVMVIGCDEVIKWNLIDEAVYDNSVVNKIRSPFYGCAPRMYKGEYHGIVERMKPIGDNIQLSHLKLQHIISKINPDGVFIDIDGINGIDLGNGKAYNPDEALNLFFQTGSVIGRSFTEDGEYNHGKVPIQELNNSAASTKIAAMINTYNHYLNQLRDVSGLNEATDASTPNEDALVGVQKLAALNTNTALRHILQAINYCAVCGAKYIIIRNNKLLQYPELKARLISQIGEYNVSTLEEIAENPLSDFAITIEMGMDEEERLRLDNALLEAIKVGDITTEDRIDILEAENLKLANVVLKVRKKKLAEQRQNAEMQKEAINAQRILQQQELATQNVVIKANAESKSKIAIEKAKGEEDRKTMTHEANLKLQLMNEEYNLNLGIEKAKINQVKERDNKKEDGESKRISQRNTEQSKLIEQRQNKLPAIDFESNEDTLDGFDFAEFDPR